MNAVPVSRPTLAAGVVPAGLSDREFLDLLKGHLAESLRTARAEFRAGTADESLPCAAYTGAVDGVLAVLFERARSRFLASAPDVGCRLAVVAVGGYGRGELCPRSDLDLLFLNSYKVDRYVESLTESILYPLWDLGLEVGHSVRNVKETLRMASVDDSIRTALLDFRFVAGDDAFFASVRPEIEKFLFFQGADRFIETKIREMRKRHDKLGSTVFVLEPNVKEGRGGLRDLHTALWIARMKYKSGGLLELRNKGVVSTHTIRAFQHVQAYLLRIRSEMHFLTGKKTDVLSVEVQEQLADVLGYRNHERSIGVERFMRSYYLHASSAAHLSDDLVEQVDRFLPEGFRKPLSVFSRKSVPGSGVVYRGRLYVKDGLSFRDDPLRVLEFFGSLQRNRASLSVQAKKHVHRLLPKVDAAFRSDPRAAKLFLAVLGTQVHLRETLLAMNACRFLGRYIPEFGPMHCKVLHDVYHVYTVDLHSILAASVFAEIGTAARRTDEEEYFLRIHRTVERKDLLSLAILLHDIGKGRGGRHSQVGAELVAQIGARMGLPAEDVADLTFLVEHHLLMALTSQRRDLHDIDLIVSFAQTVGTLKRLDLLYLLTYADMRAVGPDVWTQWKALLLAELYDKARNVLEHKPIKRPFEEQARRRKKQVEDLLDGFPAEQVERYLGRFGDRYFLATPDGRFRDHLRLLRDCDGKTPTVEFFDAPGGSASEIVILCPDEKGLFAKIAGTLAANGLNIHNASIATSLDGVALDTFYVTYMGQALTDGAKKRRVAADLAAVLSGRIDVRALLAERAVARFAREKVSRHRPTKVYFDNQVSSQFTVVDIFTYDRIGLLYDITRTLTSLGLDIVLSKISTKADQVADVFYIVGSDGGKILSEERQEEVRAALLEAIGA